MNRAQRRAAGGDPRHGQRERLRSLGSTYDAQRERIVRDAQETRRWILASTEPVEERLALVDATIAELEASSTYDLVEKPVVDILRGLRAELSGEPVH